MVRMTSTLREQIGWNNIVDLFCSTCNGGITEINNKHDLPLPGCEKEAQWQPEEKDAGSWLCGLQAAWLAPPATAAPLGKGSQGGHCQGWVTSCNRSNENVPQCGRPHNLLLSHPTWCPCTPPAPGQPAGLQGSARWWCSVHSAKHLQKSSSPLTLLC